MINFVLVVFLPCCTCLAPFPAKIGKGSAFPAKIGFQTGLLTMWLGLLTLNFRSPKGSLKFFLGSSLAHASKTTADGPILSRNAKGP